MNTELVFLSPTIGPGAITVEDEDPQWISPERDLWGIPKWIRARAVPGQDFLTLIHPYQGTSKLSVWQTSPGVWEFSLDGQTGRIERQGSGAGATIAVTVSGGTVSGSIELQDFSGDLSLTPIRVTLTPQAGGLMETQDVLLTTNPGPYSFPSAATGTYEVSFATDQWLRKVVPSVTVVADQVTTCNVSLISGDVDGDNEVTTTDTSVVLKNRGQSGD